ncbi:MAG: hypothetical protein QOH57_3590 [Mycobacterium sp.]|nr:hypothetical protein [Mycobacterium sp.]
MSVCLDGVGDSVHIVRVGDVCTNTGGRGADRCKCRIEALLVASGDEDVRAFGRQPLGSGKSDA